MLGVVSLLWTAAGSPSFAHAQPYDGRGAPLYPVRRAAKPPPPAGDPWVTVSLGAAGASTLLLGDPDQLDEVPRIAGVDEPARARFLEDRSERPAPRFSIGLHHRFRSLDLGGTLSHQIEQSIRVDGLERRMPGYILGSMSLRWRFFDRHWGGLFGGVGIGALVARPHDGYRARIAFQFEGTPDLRMTDEQLVALGASSRFGLLMYHGRDMGFFLEFVATTYVGEYRVADHQAAVFGTNECIQAGVTWSL